MAIEKTMLSPAAKTLKTSIWKKFNFKHHKFIMIGLLAALILCTVIILQSMPLSVGVLTLHPGDFSKGFTEEGEIIAAQEWPIFNPVEGELQAVKVKNGETVKKGQVLFQMNTSDLSYQLENLKAQYQSLEGQRIQNYKSPNDAQAAQQKLIIEQAEKDAQEADQNLTRMKALFQAGSISAVDYEGAQTASEKAENFLQQQKEGLQQIYEQYQTSQGAELYYVNQQNALQTQIDQTEEKIGKAVVTALQDGMVKDLSLKEGTFIPLGQQIMSIYENNGYKIESYVLASDALDIKVGSSVQVTQATSTGNKSFKGQVEAVDPSAVEKISPLGLKENRVKVTILLTDPSPAVVLGSSADVKFTTLEVPNKLQIPKTALFPYQQGEAVWIIQQGRAKIQPVKKGVENDSQVIIEQGLSDGDIVLQDPNLTNLKEGKRVKATL
ncbi:efflux RND transporter periplasmic adaptor subunit [Desulfosporosinus sp. SB140]|uniref:efflux RND transporter periplasmic adaptor subunit n=1 Tax=Desulfosporosinus paludis TaxID=3115649 RepID=UPI00389064F1